MHDSASAAGLEPVVRGLTAAAKALRLYPPTSPIPRQSVEAAAASLASFLSSEPVLSFKIVRDGLAWAGSTVAAGAPGATELADALRDHGVAELDFTPGVTPDDLLTFLTAVLEKPDDIRDRGGLAGVVLSAGVESVRVSEISLTVVDRFSAAADEDPDGFLRDLASDPDRLSAWLGVAAKGDSAALAAGLSDLARAAGTEDPRALLDALRAAMVSSNSEVRDGLVGVALDPGQARDLLGRVFTQMPAGDLAGALCAGSYGSNMLSMSTALTRLPLAEKMSEVLSQVEKLLPESGRSAKEVAFLGHMLDVRSRTSAESPLAEAEPTYAKAAELASVDPAQVADARDDVGRAIQFADERAVTTMLTLLDQQNDFALYCKTLDSLAGMVPSLLERRRLPLAALIVSELATRESKTQQPWPDLTERLRSAISEATSGRSMKALVAAVAADPSELRSAHSIMQAAGDTASQAFVEEALTHKPDGLAVAEKVVGRRIVDMLAAAAARVQWFQVAPLVTRLARESDSRAQQAIEALTRRPDEPSRREVAAGLAASGAPGAMRLLGQLLKDSSLEVAISAARAVAKSSTAGAAGVLDARLGELEIDGKDFPLGRELIGALARVADPEADAVLERLASRRALIKRGHFVEVGELARQALAQRSGGGERR